MIIVVGICSGITMLLVFYILYFKLQLRNINRQLKKRFEENTRQPISVELFNKEINALAANINKCLKAEENLRIESVREEKRFKEMIANISHDLRTPLTAIKGYQQLLAKDNLMKEQRDKLYIAQKYVKELENLTSQFFEYTYLVTSEQEMNLTPINLTNLVTESLAESVTAFEEKGINLQYDAGTAIFILADRKMTRRVLQNLIRNGVYHSAGEIMVHLCVKADNVVISFRNPVQESAEIHVERLFERFYTADKARSNSTGLGLHIVKLLVEGMGGCTGAQLLDNELEIWVELPLYQK